MKTRRISGIGLGLLLTTISLADAADPAGISPEWLATQQSKPLTGTDRLLTDIVANDKLEDIALNRARLIAHNSFINHRIKSGTITHQRGSGRCWMFAGFNVLRPHVIKKYNLKDFEFSESYLQFWDKLEKSNFFLQGMIDLADRPLDDRLLRNHLDDPLGDGGWWTYFTDLVEKYGVVPKEIMPESYSSSATGTMNALLTAKLMEMGLALRLQAQAGACAEDLCAEKEAQLTEIYRLLVLNFGPPPQEFLWRYETADSTQTVTYPRRLTPRDFFRDVIDLDLRRYVALFNYPGKPYDVNYAFEASRNMYDRSDFNLINLPIDSLKVYALRSLLDSTAVWFACDVGKENHSPAGILARGIYNYSDLYRTSFALPKADLIQMELITPNHAMTFVGVDTLGTRPMKWLVENSWGAEAGDDGLWYMYDDWFDRYLFGVIVHERYLSERIRRIAAEAPTILPPWDPMYALSHLN